MIDKKDITVIPYAFQPIFDVTSDMPQKFGHEALIRPNDEQPNIYIEKELAAGNVHKLEFETFYNAINQFNDRGLTGKLFINSYPYEFLSSEEFDVLESMICGRTQDIYVEILERNIESASKTEIVPLKLSKKISNLSERGFSLVIDDFGDGISVRTLKMFTPKIVKIDAAFITNCTSSIINRNMVEIIVDYVKSYGCKVLAEGIEDKATYDFLRFIKVDYMQGYYLGLPA